MFPGQLDFVQIQQIEGLAGDGRLQVASLVTMGCPLWLQLLLDGFSMVPGHYTPTTILPSSSVSPS